MEVRRGALKVPFGVPRALFLFLVGAALLGSALHLGLLNNISFEEKYSVGKKKKKLATHSCGSWEQCLKPKRPFTSS